MSDEIQWRPEDRKEQLGLFGEDIKILDMFVRRFDVGGEILRYWMNGLTNERDCQGCATENCLI